MKLLNARETNNKRDAKKRLWRELKGVRRRNNCERDEGEYKSDNDVRITIAT